MTGDVRRGLFRNWGLKLAALFLSLLLYVAVAAQEQVTQELPMRLEVRVPPGRTLLAAPEALTVVLRGKIAELLRLRLFRQVITLQVPDTLSTATWTTALQVGSVDLPKGADVQVAEIKPSSVTIQLDSVASKEVPIVARVTVAARVRPGDRRRAADHAQRRSARRSRPPVVAHRVRRHGAHGVRRRPRQLHAPGPDRHRPARHRARHTRSTSASADPRRRCSSACSTCSPSRAARAP